MKVRIMEHKSTREKMLGMSKKEKMKYIWEYYKYHIVGTLVGIGIIVSIASGMMNQQQSIIGVTIMGKYVDSDKLTELQNQAGNDLIKDNPKNKKIIRHDFLTVTDNPMDQYTRASKDKITLTVSSKELDILIIDKASYDSYVKLGMFLRLDTLSNFSDLDLKNRSTVKGAIEDDGVSKEAGIYGISMDKLPALQALKYDTKDTVLCVISNTKSLDTSFSYIKWLLNKTSF
jgi:hypothetical protein